MHAANESNTIDIDAVEVNDDHTEARRGYAIAKYGIQTLLSAISMALSIAFVGFWATLLLALIGAIIAFINWALPLLLAFASEESYKSLGTKLSFMSWVDKHIVPANA